MPSPNTFSIKPIKELLDRYLSDDLVVVDPFARDSSRACLTNDLNPETKADHHMDAVEFLCMLADEEYKVDVVLLDPPYSPRQIAECYKGVGRSVGMKETQNARLYKSCKDAMDRMVVVGGLVICCGWNSGGMGSGRKYKLLEILLVNHGGGHNDTIVTVERKL